MKLKIGVFSNDENRTLINRVLRENFRLYVGKYILAFFYMALTAIATGLSAYLMRDITLAVFTPEKAIQKNNAVLNNENHSFLVQWFHQTRHQVGEFFSHLFQSDQPGIIPLVNISLAIMVVYFVKGISQYKSTTILSRIGNNIVARQQQRISNHITYQSLSFFIHYPSSDLITRTSQAANCARDVMNLLMTRVQDFFTAFALLFTMFKLDWRLSLSAFFIMLPLILGLGNILKRVRKIALAEMQGLIHVISALQESILGNKLIKIYNLEEHMRMRFTQAIQAVEQRANKLTTVSARTAPMMEMMGGIAVASIIFYGGYRNLQSGTGANELIAFLTALLLAYEPIKRIAKMNVSLQTSLIGVKMLYEVLDSDYSIRDAPNAKPLELTKGEIELNNISFGYNPQKTILNDISLICPGGQVTALVGPSGGGKSTILNLIEYFYKIERGTICIDQQNIAQVQIKSLRDHISLVSQDTFLFSDTIWNNIRFARQDATDAEVKAAAQAAFAHDFIMKQPLGYDTQIGENGGSLSGGQRQRISIARAFLKNAPILLLDEATSALDSESEHQIQLAFDTLMQGRTTIVIAHRFSTIRKASRIHVIEQGRLVASGSHAELITDKDGLYSHLYRLQFQEHHEIA